MKSTRIRARAAAGAVAILAMAGGALATGSAANAAGVSGPAFYVDGDIYRTVGTPTDLSGTEAPASSFQPLYAFPNAEQLDVSTAAPGDPGYVGGRWMVHALELPNGYDAAVMSGDLDSDGVLDSDEEIAAAVSAGDLVIGDVVKTFACPVIPLPAN